MKAILDLALKQSLTMTNDMRLAIDMLAMSSQEIDQLLEEELVKNPCLEESEYFNSRRENLLEPYDEALTNASYQEDFRNHLLRQVGEARFNFYEKIIAEMLINNLDDDGLLHDRDETYQAIITEIGVFAEWIESVRRRIMHLDPLGCGALSINETLVFQAKEMSSHSHPEFATLLEDLRQNPQRKLTQGILNTLKGDGALHDLKWLNPRPSLPLLARASHEGVLPDVHVHTMAQGFNVSLNQPQSRKILVTKNYYQVKAAMVKDSRKRAAFLMRCLVFRERSLLTVAKIIVEHQKNFFREQGRLRPLTLREVSQDAGLHESSVSRLVKSKYLFCERGFFPLKYFFSAAVQGQEDEDRSSQSIKDQIREMLAKENKTAPLSDQKIADALAQVGTHISRRTVTKYRENMRISTAVERRRI